MKSSIAVWHEQERIGTLLTENGVWTFEYHPSWKARSEAFTLSPHFPLDTDTFVDTGDDRRVLWFFDNLLPERNVDMIHSRVTLPAGKVDQPLWTKRSTN